MAEREREDEKEEPIALLIVAPKTLDSFIAVVTGNYQGDVPSVHTFKSGEVFNDDLLLDHAQELREARQESMQDFLENSKRQLCALTCARIGTLVYREAIWQGKRTIRLVLADSFESFLKRDHSRAALGG